MSTASEPADDPKDLLADARALALHVRRAQRTTWIALLVLGAVVLLAIPFYRYGSFGPSHCQTSADGHLHVCLPYSTLVLWYWPVALVAAYALIGAAYARHARARGVGTRVRPYVVGGIVLAVVATLLSLWDLQHPLAWAQVADPLVPASSPWVPELNRVIGPTGAIGLGLLVLARVERSRALAAFGVLYLFTVLTSLQPVQHVAALSTWFFLPRLVVPGLVLLVGSGLFALLEHGRAGAR